MFGRKSTNTSFSTGSTTLVSKSTEVIGDIHFSGNLMVEGRVKGNIRVSEEHDGQARIMETGFVEGDIRVPTLVINGTINGDVYSDKHIELAAKAVINGNVHYALIEVVKGAQVNGNLVFTDPAAERPAATLLESTQVTAEENTTVYSADVQLVNTPK